MVSEREYRVHIRETHQMEGTIQVRAESEEGAKREAVAAAREGAVDLHFLDGRGGPDAFRIEQID